MAQRLLLVIYLFASGSGGAHLSTCNDTIVGMKDMKNWKLGLATLIAAGTMTIAAPASATIFEYGFNNGDVLTINTETQSATWVGATIDTSMTSPDFANFTGGANPNFMATLTSLDGTRIINGVTYTDNPLYIDTTHPQKLIGTGNSVFNLWAWWGDPIKGGDYKRGISSYSATEVPAPGMLGLFGLGLAALGFRTARRRKATAAA